MKKLVIALSAIAALTGSAFAADMAPAPLPYSKAPVVVPTPSWTGFYLFGGGGYGVFDSATHVNSVATGLPLTIDQKVGGDGYFGTVGAGYDWQFNGSWVGGVFADGQFGSIRGSLTDPLLGPFGTTGGVKDRTNVAAGVRVGYLVAPNVLSYVNGGYSYAEFSGTTPLRQHLHSISMAGSSVAASRIT
jgi:outer membrane immunogenic protein